MATIEQILRRVEIKLELAEGIDVQIHAEDKMLESIRTVYERLFNKNWWRNLMQNETLTLDGTTGQVVGDLSNRILRYDDIHSVFFDTDTRPLTLMTFGQNNSRVRYRAIAPSSDKTKVFKVVPADSVGPVNIWYRTRIAPSVWEQGQYDTEIPFDDNLMIAGVCAEFLIDEGINEAAAQRFAGEYADMFSDMLTNEFQGGISKTPQSGANALTEWTEAGYNGW